MKILHITPWPGPPFDGGTVNRFQFLKWLAKRHDCRVVALCPERRACNYTPGLLSQLGIPNEGLSTVTVPDYSSTDRLRGLLASSLPPGVSFLERTLGSRLRAITSSEVDQWRPAVMVIWSGNLAAILANVRGVQKMLYACDSMALLNTSIARNAQSIFRKIYNAIVAGRYEAFERYFYPRYDQVVFISKRDAEHVDIGGNVSVSVIANGVDTDQFYPRCTSTNVREHCTVIFHGNLGYIANDDCVRFLSLSVGPVMLAALGREGFMLRVVGGNASTELRALRHRRNWLRIDGYCEDLPPLLRAADLYAAPLSMGAGAKNKILEAMASGLPVVGSAEAFSGLDVIDGQHVAICQREDTAETLLDLWRDPERMRFLGRNAREFVCANHVWSKSAAALEKVLVGCARSTKACGIAAGDDPSYGEGA